MTLEFSEDAIDAVADVAVSVNSSVENIGARRLQTVMERVLDEVSVRRGPDRPAETGRRIIDAASCKSISAICTKTPISADVLKESAARFRSASELGPLRQLVAEFTDHRHPLLDLREGLPVGRTSVERVFVAQIIAAQILVAESPSCFGFGCDWASASSGRKFGHENTPIEGVILADELDRFLRFRGQSGDWVNRGT